MAQNVLVPFSFEFRKRPVEWEQVSARITGWVNDLTVPSKLIAQVANGKGTKTINLLFSEFPEGKEKPFWTDSRRPEGEGESDICRC